MWPKRGDPHSQDTARSPFCGDRDTLSTELTFLQIRHLHISQNTPCLPPTPHPQFCITFVFYFSWVLQQSQEKLKSMLIQKFLGDAKVENEHFARPASSTRSGWNNQNISKPFGQSGHAQKLLAQAKGSTLFLYEHS